MAVKVSDLLEKTTPLAATDLLMVVTGGESKKVKVETVEAPLRAYTELKASQVQDNVDTLSNTVSSNLTAANAHSDANLVTGKAYTDSEIDGLEVIVKNYTDAKVAALVASAPATLDTLDELSAALNDDPNFATTIATSLGNRVRTDTAAQGLNPTQKTNAKTNLDLQNVDNVSDANKPISVLQQAALDLKASITSLNLKADLASPTFTGTPLAPTAALGTNTTQLATTAFVKAAGDLKANLASPTFTGTPLAPTPTLGDNTTQIATTAFVKAAIDVIPASVVVAALDINWAAGNVLYKDVAANSALTFSNVTDGKVVSFIIRNTSGATITLTLPTGIYKAADLDLTIETLKENVYTGIRSNGKTYISGVSKLVLT